MADIAVYKKGPARPTGGAGCICFLIGPNAPITIEPIRSTFVDHEYDFFKPDPCKLSNLVLFFIRHRISNC